MAKKAKTPTHIEQSSEVNARIPTTQSSMREPVANIPPFGLRMQPDLKRRVEEAAAKNNRSINAEIVATLEEVYPPTATFTDFMRDWVAPIAEATTKEEMIRLVDAANFEAELRDAGYRVGLDVDEMKPFITFHRFDIPEFEDKSK
ncbi:Arc family DNA-binding protein [Ochrobactrum anthropi]|uniref:Arc family DNA-binding protein n=1 Tax=Brucella anthropi TaxID=529 RepID=UPI00194EEABC|nr:Arc family DNA-binding protein [Brucella anthropi]MBM6397921.1 Arc family DNA-binding protein [Brucella anthropi]